MERRVQAVIFSDTVIMIDDYKSQHRESRKKAFPSLLSIESELLPYNQLVAETKKISDDIVPRVEAGQFTDGDFKPFFDQLRMNVTFTWDMTSSEYFLTQKMLAGAGGIDLEKYSTLSSAIYGELLDKYRSTEQDAASKKSVLVSSSGAPIDSGFKLVDQGGHEVSATVSKQADIFLAGLSWLAFRTVFYSLAASNLGTDLFLHPIRHSFQANLLSKLHKNNPSTFKPLIDAMNDCANKSLNRIVEYTQPFVTKHQTPLFVAWLAKTVGDPSDYVEYAYSLRQEPLFIQARQRLIELETSIECDDFTNEANKIVLEVQKSLEGITSKYSVTTSQGVSTSNFITLWNLTTVLSQLPKIPNVDVRLRKLEFLKNLVPQKGFKGIYRTLISDLTQVSRLGEYHDILCSKVVLDREANDYYDKQEDIKFRKVKSHWKIPM